MNFKYENVIPDFICSFSEKEKNESFSRTLKATWRQLRQNFILFLLLNWKKYMKKCHWCQQLYNFFLERPIWFYLGRFYLFSITISECSNLDKTVGKKNILESTCISVIKKLNVQDATFKLIHEPKPAAPPTGKRNSEISIRYSLTGCPLFIIKPLSNQLPCTVKKRVCTKWFVPKFSNTANFVWYWHI